MIQAIKMMTGGLTFIIGGLALYKGYGLGWAVVFAIVVGSVAVLGLPVLFPWVDPGKVRETCRSVFFYDVVYLIALMINSFRNGLTTMVGLNIDTIVWWLSAWLCLLTTFAYVRSAQVKNGQSWQPKAGFGTFTWAVVFVLNLGLTFNSLIEPSAVGGLYALIGMPDKAIVALTTAIKAQPKDADSYQNRGVVYVQTNKPNEALADFTNAIELKSEQADAHLMRTVALVMLGEENRAKADIERCLALEPTWKTKVDRLVAQAKRQAKKK